MNKHPILVVDDEVEMRIAISETLKEFGFPVEMSKNGIEALKKLRQKSFSMVITDMIMPKKGDLELLKDIKTRDLTIPVLIITAYGTIKTAEEAVNLGAFDFIQKPFNPDLLMVVVKRAFDQRDRNAIKKHPSISMETNKIDLVTESDRILTSDPGMEKLMGVAKKIARSKTAVLIQGEIGVGKDRLAQYIHDNSDRAESPFVTISGRIKSENFLESEQGEHLTGVFTSLREVFEGKIEQAAGGSLFIDEVSELTLPQQAILEIVLKAHEVSSNEEKGTFLAYPRVITTTTHDLFQRVEEETFREDLYYRLSIIHLQVPPLRERRGDIPMLAEFFLKKHTKQNNLQLLPISIDAMEVLCNYPWRGNLLELENVILSSLFLCSEDEIQPYHLKIWDPPVNLT